MNKSYYYNSIAKGYNELHGEEQKKKLAILKKFFKPKKTDKLLDVGCGTGISSEWECKVVGVDPAQELLKQSKTKIICASAESLPFEDNEFDYVISITAIQNFKNKKEGLKEIERVGKKYFGLTVLKKS